VTALAPRRWTVRATASSSVLDADRVLQAVLALVDNAVRHTEEGDEVAVTLDRVERGTVVRVSDSGPGIPADLVPHVFERFRRGGERREGSGLGLAVVRAIAEGHAGRVRVEATGPGGTTIALHLPDEEPA
jgi:signal transduction histidine kinase